MQPQARVKVRPWRLAHPKLLSLSKMQLPWLLLLCPCGHHAALCLSLTFGPKGGTEGGWVWRNFGAITPEEVSLPAPACQPSSSFLTLLLLLGPLALHLQLGVVGQCCGLR